MKSLILFPGGADKCMMTHHLPFFFGTTPSPEQRRLGIGGDGKGPSMRPAAHFLVSS